MEILIQFIKSRASTEAKASEQWKAAGNHHQADCHATASNALLDVLSFVARHPELSALK